MIDDETFSANGQINGIVNITQDAVFVSECNVFGIAANHAENPIGLPPPDPPPAVPMANMQLIHNVVGVVDVRPLERAENTPTGVIWANNLEFNGVTGYKSVTADVYNLELTTSNQDRQTDVFELDWVTTQTRGWCWRCRVLVDRLARS